MALDPITLGFIIAIIGAVAIVRLRGASAKDAGGLAVRLGILGTFAGILIALLGFDTTDINGSVPRLIEGMKTAFVTSVTGMGLSVLMRFGELMQQREVGASGVSAQDYLQQMIGQTEQLQKLNDGIGEGESLMVEQLQKLNDGIGEGEGSMVGQIKLLRSDLNDFARKVSESSTDAIVEALKEVVSNFNSTINEQFGENFKELNSAVGKLVDWMAKHRELVEASHKALTEALCGQADSAESLEKIASEMQKIQDALATSGARLKEIEGSLKRLPSTLEGVSGGVERLGGSSEKFGEIMDTLHTSSEALGGASKSLAELARQTPEASKALKEVAGTVQRTFEGIKTQQARLTEELTHDLKRAGEANASALKAQQESLGRDLSTANSKNAAAVAEQLQVFDDMMGKQLTNALTALGDNLAQISGKFVEDYTPLTEELRRVVQISEEIQRGKRG